MSVFGGEFRCRRASHTHSYLACDVRGGTVQWNAKTVLSLFEIEDVRTYILVQIQISNFKFSCARMENNKIEGGSGQKKNLTILTYLTPILNFSKLDAC